MVLSPDHIEVYLCVRDSQVSLLSIPHNDIRRLAIHPLKWLRFVMFCICGAQGDLFATLDGPLVRYESTSLDQSKYYYKPYTEIFHFVDPDVLIDKASSTTTLECSDTFRRKIVDRDGSCIVTGRTADVCDAVHLIPEKKNDEYIHRVCEVRSPCYTQTQPFSISGIDDVRNGVLLNKDVHALFGHGNVAFLKTPNFAMVPDDLHRFYDGPSLSECITLQHLVLFGRRDTDILRNIIEHIALAGESVVETAFGAGFSVDPRFPTSRSGAQNIPPTLILDFLYGAATYKLWKSKSLHDVVEEYRIANFTSIPPLPSRQPSDDEDNGGAPGADDDPGGDYQPSPRGKTTRFSRMEDGLAEAMDEMAFVMMFLSGITPQEAARRQIERAQEEERLAQEASQRKVMEWKKTLD